MPTLSAEQIARLLPHSGPMCLLDGVRHYDEQSLIAHSKSHQTKAHPLALDGKLDLLAGIEYGAQAAGLHLALQNTQHYDNKIGLLLQVKQLKSHHPNMLYLSDCQGELMIQVHCEINLEQTACYGFTLQNDNKQPLLSGELMIQQVDHNTIPFAS